MDANRNQLWARVLVEELAACGVREFCIAPGSRSTALVFAAAADERITTRVFLDERSAAFFALGVGRATGIPAAVITTSGTAVANLLPAVVEASQSETPLLLLTADRPHRLRDSDANQAIRQPGIFGEYTREAWDLPLPVLDRGALLHLRSVGCRAVASALGLPGGPVHLNVPFEKPLEPVEVAADRPGDDLADSDAVRGRQPRAWTDVRVRVPRIDDAGLEALVHRIAAAERPVLVVGGLPAARDTGPELLRFAAQAGMPVLADPLSGARFGPAFGAVRTAHHDLFLRDASVADALAPDFVVRVGRAPTSASVLRWLEGLAVDQVVIDAGGRWKDHLGRATLYLPFDAADLASRARLKMDPAAAGWRRMWSEVDAAAEAALLEAPGPVHEGHVARVALALVETDTPVFLSSSMPIRDVDAYAAAVEDAVPVVHGNRGASGIDGIVSTALGVAAGSGRRTLALLGDLAFLHDVNGLLATREDGVDVLFVVVNNDGGGIFHMLPVREHQPEFTRFFATPHGLDLSHASALYGVPHTVVDLGDDLATVLEREWATPGTRVLEIRSDRDANRVGHAATAAAVMDRVRAALNHP